MSKRIIVGNPLYKEGEGLSYRNFHKDSIGKGYYENKWHCPFENNPPPVLSWLVITSYFPVLPVFPVLTSITFLKNFWNTFYFL